MIFCQNNIAESITKASQTERNYIQKNQSQFVWKIVKDFWYLPIIMSCYVTKTYLCLNSRNFWKNISHHYTQYSDELVNLINFGVLFKWKFVTQMRASCFTTPERRRCPMHWCWRKIRIPPESWLNDDHFYQSKKTILQTS